MPKVVVNVNDDDDVDVDVCDKKNVVLTSQRRQNDKRSAKVRANVFEVFKKVLSSKLYLYEKFDLNVTYW